MLNPDFIKWYEGILSLWPTSNVTVVTNGSHLMKWPQLYDILLEYRDRTLLEITNHNNNETAEIFDVLKNKFLKGKIKRTYSRRTCSDTGWKLNWEQIRGSDWPDCDHADLFESLPEHIKTEVLSKFTLGGQHWTDENGVQVITSTVTKFFTSAVIRKGDKITLHNSDVNKAAKQCISKFCHHFSKGKLSKCGVAGILPEFIDQFEIDISESDRTLIKSYSPAEHNWDDEKLDVFFQNLNEGAAISQCKFCSEEYEEIDFQSGTKKIKLVKMNDGKK
jgi:hypothetical protein